VGLLSEVFATVWTAEWSGVVVDSLVLQERAFLLEILAALDTLEQPEVGMGMLVHFVGCG
jgi:hypothetical protein